MIFDPFGSPFDKINPLLSGSEEVLSPYLDGVLDSAVFDIDVTQSDSYSGTGTTWANLIANPADGSSQTDYDFYLGNGVTPTTYPTFNGSAGSQSAYWSFDGGDYFTLKSGANSNFLSKLHTTTANDFWVVVCWYQVQAAWGNNVLFTTSGGNDAAGRGIALWNLSSENVRANLILNGVDQSLSGANDPTLGPKIMIFSRNGSTYDSRLWYRGNSVVQASMPTTTTDAATIPARISGFSASFLMSAQQRMYSLAMGNEYLDNTKAAAIISHLETRHGRTYT